MLDAPLGSPSLDSESDALFSQLLLEHGGHLALDFTQNASSKSRFAVCSLLHRLDEVLLLQSEEDILHRVLRSNPGEVSSLLVSDRAVLSKVFENSFLGCPLTIRTWMVIEGGMNTQAHREHPQPLQTGSATQISSRVSAMWTSDDSARSS
jgi:hypothetical protein